VDARGERAGAAQGQPGHRNPRLDEAPLERPLRFLLYADGAFLF